LRNAVVIHAAQITFSFALDYPLATVRTTANGTLQVCNKSKRSDLALALRKAGKTWSILQHYFHTDAACAGARDTFLDTYKSDGQ
jgi:hypothetical protein